MKLLKLSIADLYALRKLLLDRMRELYPDENIGNKLSKVNKEIQRRIEAI